jgi:tetratricopeptide (TPR) repeat protein
MSGSPHERRQALANEAIAIARRSGDDATIVRVVHTLSNPLGVPELLQQAMDWETEALVRAERLGDPVQLFWVARSHAGSAARTLDIDEMDRCLEIMESRAAQLDQPILNWVHSWARAVRAQIAGDTEQAEQWASEGLQIATDSGQPDATFIYAAQLGAVKRQRGTYGELAPRIEQMVVDAPDLAGSIVAALALAHVEAGHIDDARRLLEQAAAADFDFPRDGSWLSTLACYAEAAIACRDPNCSRTLFDRLAPWADQAPYPGLSVDSPISHYLGGLATVLGRYDEADAYFGRAALLNDRASAKFFAARNNLSWATMFAERNAPGDNERARDLLTEAHAVALAHGYASIERRAAEALQRFD